jgi:hypothetical protein
LTFKVWVIINLTVTFILSYLFTSNKQPQKRKLILIENIIACLPIFFFILLAIFLIIVIMLSVWSFINRLF